MRLISLTALGIKAAAVVSDRDLKAVVKLSCRYRHGSPAVLGFPYSVSDGVFYDRLQCERRKIKPGRLDVVNDLKRVVKPQLFDRKIRLGVLKLLGEADGNVGVQRIHISAQIGRKVNDRLLCHDRIAAAEIFDDRQRIEQKMRLYLAEHDIDLQLVDLPLLLIIQLRAVADRDDIQQQSENRS